MSKSIKINAILFTLPREIYWNCLISLYKYYIIHKFFVQIILAESKTQKNFMKAEYSSSQISKLSMLVPT